jgi:glutathione synthase/RimK-type ligase-like ATP-grasp enzyme
VARELEDTHRATCSIVPVDRLSGAEGFSWSPTDEVAPTIPTVSDRPVRIDQVDLIWWRRFYVDSQISSEVSDPHARDLIVRDGRAAFLGALFTEFTGRWVSEPDASRRAEIKPLQLAAALQAGLAVPRTLISQDPSTIRQFVADVGMAVAKPVTGTPYTPIYTGLIDGTMLRDDRQLALCPAIYQEYIPGKHHLRICCFGGECHSALITAAELDWRVGSFDARPTETPAEIERALRDVLDLMGLRMGVIDMKITDEGQPVWFELNPQGQFLFLEAMCDMDLTRRFGEFLINEAQRP